MRPTTWLKIVLLLALCLALPLGCAQAASNVTLKADIGYDGVITYLNTMPLRVTLQNDGSDAELMVAVNVERSVSEFDRYEYPIALASGAQMQLTLPLTLNYKQAQFTVEVLQGDELIASTAIKPKKLISPATLLVGVLSQDAQALTYMNINTANDQLLRGDVWQTVALTQESFPSQMDLLRAFRILVVDGVDVSAFSVAQQEALQQWLREGGIVIVGGGSTASLSLRAFSPLTGVIATAPYQAQGVDQALLRALSNTQFAPSVSDRMAGSVLLCGLMGGKGAVAELDGKPLIDRCPVEQGVVYTAAFSLSEKPLSGWSGMTGFWQRVLLSQDQALYQHIMNALNNYYNHDDNFYVNSWLLRMQRMSNDDPVLLVILLVAAFVLLGGFGSYFVLKKLDKREWLWLTVPVLSLACAGALYLLGGRMNLARPAMASYAIVRVDENGYTDLRVAAGVAAAERAPLGVSAANGVRLYPGSDYGGGYYNDSDEETERPKKLRYTYTEGDVMRLTLPETEPWAVQGVLARPDASPDCAVSATVWWEEDGLHGQIINGSDLILKNGYALTSMGFHNVPELLPGQSFDFAIVYNDQAKQGVIKEGELIQSGWQDSYGIVSAALYPEYQRGETAANLDPQEQRERELRNSLINVCMERWNGYTFFRYVTFCDSVGEVPLQVNGRPVQRAAHSAVIDVQMAYRVVSDSGLVRLTRGMIPAYYCNVYADGTVVNSGSKMDDYAYFSLRDEPVICFALGEIKGLALDQIAIDSATFNCESYGGLPRVWLYNATAGRWEEAQYSALPVVVSGETLMRCADAQGQLFVRMTAGVGQNNNAEVYNPVLTLEGRGK